MVGIPHPRQDGFLAGQGIFDLLTCRKVVVAPVGEGGFARQAGRVREQMADRDGRCVGMAMLNTELGQMFGKWVVQLQSAGVPQLQ